MGPSGIGKSSVAVQYACAAARRGDLVLFLMFDERLETLFARAAGLGMDFEEHVDAGRIEVRQIASAELSLGQFVQLIRTAVEQRDARLVVIDSLSGYLAAMPGEASLMLQLHELLAYLGQKAVTTLLVYGQKGLFTVAPASSDLDISYLTDNVLLFRYYEHNGEVRQAISVFKRRGGPHERTIRDLRLGPTGIEVGPRLREFRGVLTGQPVYTGSEAKLGRHDSVDNGVDSDQMRVLVLAPAGRDAAVTAEVLSEGGSLLEFALRLMSFARASQRVPVPPSSPRKL